MKEFGQTLLPYVISWNYETKAKIAAVRSQQREKGTIDLWKTDNV